jgi:hypothetical protein
MVIRRVNICLATLLWFVYIAPIIMILDLNIEKLSDILGLALGASLIIIGSLFPQVITHSMILRYKNISSQYVLLISQFAYGAWLIFMYFSIMGDSDAQGGLMFLFVGICSLPVMGFLWVKADYYYKKSKELYDVTKT